MSIKKYINNYNSLFTELDEVEILKKKLELLKIVRTKKFYFLEMVEAPLIVHILQQI